MSVQDRTELIAHYVIFRSRPEQLGSVKLNKVLWFADLESYQRLGVTISRQESYEKRQYGPVPNTIKESLGNLIKDRKIVRRTSSTPVGSRREFLWTKPPIISSLTADEIDILNRTIQWVCEGYSAETISDKTHDALWEETPIGSQIEIRAAIISPKPIVGKYLDWALKNADAQA